jgi:hypothetical protein
MEGQDQGLKGNFQFQPFVNKRHVKEGQERSLFRTDR